MKKNLLLLTTIVIGLAVAVSLVRGMDAHQSALKTQFGDEPLYVNGKTAKRMSLAFNGLAADWYWMRTLQYVGGKIVAYEDSHDGRVNFGNLSDLDLRLLLSLLRVSTTLDPQFIAPYEYGAAILPELNSDDAIALLNSGIAANPSVWRLYQHLGYVYWQRHDYQKASEVYGAGAKLPGAPAWMAAISARMKAEGGSRDAAREMYRHLYDSSSDEAVKQMVTKQLMRLDSLDEREAIHRVLDAYAAKNGHCISSWPDVAEELRSARLKVDPATGAPLDPSATPYKLINNKADCDVDLDEKTQVPKR
jgi:tetratricopeptide (TPR) repeat protein